MTPGAVPRRGLAARALEMLAVGLLVAVYAVQAIAVQDDRRSLEHDEILTHMAASGHYDDWSAIAAGGPPAGRWEPIATYRTYLALDEASTFGEVRSNLDDYEVHPSLYFWAVLVARDGGLDLLAAGLVLNIVAGAAIILILYGLLRETFDRTAAVVGAAAFVVSPASALAASLARPYVLMSLATAALLWTTTRLAAPAPRGGWWAALAAVTAAGLLANYQFAFPLVGGLALLVLWPRPMSWTRAGLPLAAAGAGAVVAALLQPGFAEQLSRGRTVSPGFSLGQLPDRVWTAFGGLLDVISRSRWIESLTAPAAAAVVVTIAALIRWHRPLRSFARQHVLVAAAASIGSAALAGYLVSYGTGSTPPHAVGRQYVAVLTVPLAVAAGTLVAQARGRAWRAVAALGVAGALLVALQSHVAFGHASIHRQQAVDAVEAATAIIADCSSRGHLAGVALWSDPNTDVLLLTTDERQPLPPRQLDPSSTLLAHSAPISCNGPSGVPADDALAGFALRRGDLVGFMGEVEIYRVEPLDSASGG